MTEEIPSSVLGRMTHRQVTATPEVPLTASRAVRLAVTRAAQNTVGLSLTVLGMAEDVNELDTVLDTLSDEQLLVALTRGDMTVGIIVCDASLAAAAVEMQATGILLAIPADARPLTRVDAAMTEPFLYGLLAELAETTPRTALDGWTEGAKVGSRFKGVRAVGFALPDQTYRMIRLSLELGAGDRQAELMIALPLQPSMVSVKPPSKKVPDWTEHFQAAVLDAPALLDAVLHQFKLPLPVATSLEIGQVLPLTGCTVGAVRMVDPSGHTVARGKLGQIAGQIAVKIADLETAEMVDLPQPGSLAEPDFAQISSPLEMEMEMEPMEPLGGMDPMVSFEEEAEEEAFS